MTTHRKNRRADEIVADPERAAPQPHVGLTQRFSHLYSIAQDSQNVFGSPLGPYALGDRSYHLPRFVYFGPQSSDDSVRLAFYAGFDGTDTRGTAALLHLVERLALTPDIGHGVNLSFFPVVNPSGQEFSARVSADGVDLVAEHWGRSVAPEIALLRQDALARGYHGFVRIEAAPVESLVGTIRSAHRAWNPRDIGLVPEEADEVFPVRWTTEAVEQPIERGPLSIADDFVSSPFEVVLRIPTAWNADLHREAITHVVKRFITRYRAAFAYGIHL